MNPKEGLICSLTGEKANFSGECSDFTKDENVKDYSGIDDIKLEPKDIQSNLSFEELEELKMDQNLPMAIMAGLITGFIGALIWAGISVLTLYQINYLAIGIGAGIGIAIRYFGKGLDTIFGVVGALIALSSIILGNVFTIIGLIANEEGVGIMEVMTWIDFTYIPELLIETFDPRDLLFYGFALAMGYKFSFRQFSTNELDDFRKRKIQAH
ncbi:hypothetical protein [Flammeovirga sp. SJP92]|uniref:hypothetical protein n=1 Tax=Flammeovirga sp. SJP92 TaxID=1775430 RepID=UPI0012FAC3BF|nr:hypothetical protein [Flammeovirga sp. SJP92]